MASTDTRQLRWADLLLILAYPLYQTFGTIRHEGSHALAALMEGADVTKFVIYPQTETGRFTWGYTRWSGDTGWFTDAAPYLCDLLWFVGFFFLITRIPWKNHWVWINLVILGVIGPLVNSFYQWMVGSFGSKDADVAKWIDAAGGAAVVVHLYFLITVTAYVLGLLVIVWKIPSKLADQVVPSDY